MNVIKQLNKTSALEEIVRFINLVSTELHYRVADYDTIYLMGQNQGYKHIVFRNGFISADESLNSFLQNEFNSFIKHIGTTDENGQLMLCDEYKERFSEHLNKRKMKEKEKIQVNTALSVLGALTVILFFL